MTLYMNQLFHIPGKPKGHGSHALPEMNMEPEKESVQRGRWSMKDPFSDSMFVWQSVKGRF